MQGWWGEHGWQVVWAALILGVIAVVVLLLIAISIAQRLRPLQRASMRLAERIERIARLAEQLDTAQMEQMGATSRNRAGS